MFWAVRFSVENRVVYYGHRHRQVGIQYRTVCLDFQSGYVNNRAESQSQSADLGKLEIDIFHRKLRCIMSTDADF